MPYNGSGTYSLPTGNPVVTGTTITVTWGNTTMSDVATALTNCITRDGQSPPTANLPMGGFKLSGLAAGTVAGDSVRYEQAALLALANTFTQPQIISMTGVGSPLAATVSTGDATLSIKSLAGNGASYFLASADGTGRAGISGYGGATYRGELSWNNLGEILLNTAAAAPVYSVDSSKVHKWFGPVGTGTFTFGDDNHSSYMTISINEAGGTTALVASTASMIIEGSTSVIQATLSGGYKAHYQVNSSGNHTSDGPRHNGTLDSVYQTRRMGRLEGTTPAVANGFGIIGISRVAGSGRYYVDFTATPGTVSTNYIALATVISAGISTAYAAHCSPVSSTRIEVTIVTGSGTYVDKDFFLEIKY